MLPPKDLETRIMNLESENQELRRALQEVMDSYKAMMNEKDPTKIMPVHGLRVTTAVLNATTLLRR